MKVGGFITCNEQTNSHTVTSSSQKAKAKSQFVTGMEYGCQDGNRVICSINMSTQLLYDYMHSPVDHTQGLE